VMASGVREDMRAGVEAGFKFILFRQPEPEQVDAVEAYINSLEPMEGPLANAEGELKKSVRRGRDLFEDEDRTACITCHPPPLYTDLSMKDVGTRGEFDKRDDFDTPTLVELFRSAPYLHDGSAVTLQDVLTTANPNDLHGKTADLTDEEIDDLAAYLGSL